MRPILFLLLLFPLIASAQPVEKDHPRGDSADQTLKGGYWGIEAFGRATIGGSTFYRHRIGEKGRHIFTLGPAFYLPVGFSYRVGLIGDYSIVPLRYKKWEWKLGLGVHKGFNIGGSNGVEGDMGYNFLLGYPFSGLSFHITSAWSIGLNYYMFYDLGEVQRSPFMNHWGGVEMSWAIGR